MSEAVIAYGKELGLIAQLLRQAGLSVIEADSTKALTELYRQQGSSTVVVTHGGDGYLLEAERLTPGWPKLPIRYNSICKSCIEHDTTHAIKALAAGTISHTAVSKLTATFDDKSFTALNEFSLHHQIPNQAIRFSVQINDERHIEQAIGDGVIVATPFGSHAYYRSITSSTFRIGIGIAFNNSTEAINHMVVNSEDMVRLKVTRGPAYLLIDNDPDYIILDAGCELTISQAPDTAIILGLDLFRCPDCGDSAVAINPANKNMAEESR